MVSPRGKAVILVISLALVLSLGAEGASFGPRRGLVGSPGETVFDVTKYEAKANGKFENAQPFMKAWNAACKSSGAAKLLIPPGSFAAGEVVFQGPCTAKPITIEVQGTVLARPDLSLYSSGVWISIQYVDGVIVNGGGTFNGQGEANWKSGDCGSAGCDVNLPASFVFMHCTNAAMQHINFVNAMGFNMKVTSSNNVKVDNLHITAPGNSPNTDGIHISKSVGVNITNCVIGVGDDCISIGDGNTNIDVSKITCGPGHGISVGSLGKRPEEKAVSGVTVSNCTLTGTTNGARIKTFHNSPHILASHITFKDLIMKDVKNPIIIDQNYASKKISGESNIKISDVHFRNIKGTTLSNVAVALSCSKTNPCEGIELVDIDLTLSPNAPIKGSGVSSLCDNAKPTFSGKMNPAACNGQSPASASASPSGGTSLTGSKPISPPAGKSPKGGKPGKKKKSPNAMSQ